MKAISSSRRGRPAKGARDPVSHRSPRDSGTPEQQIKRAVLVSSSLVSEQDYLDAVGFLKGERSYADLRPRVVRLLRRTKSELYADHPLGVIYARDVRDASGERVVDIDRLVAGIRYANLYRSVYGRTTPPAVAFYEVYVANIYGVGSLAELDVMTEIRKQRRFERADLALRQAGRQAARITRDVAVYLSWPSFLSANDFTSEKGRLTTTARDAMDLRHGLSMLNDHFQGRVLA